MKRLLTFASAVVREEVRITKEVERDTAPEETICEKSYIDTEDVRLWIEGDVTRGVIKLGMRPLI